MKIKAVAAQPPQRKTTDKNASVIPQFEDPVDFKTRLAAATEKVKAYKAYFYDKGQEFPLQQEVIIASVNSSSPKGAAAVSEEVLEEDNGEKEVSMSNKQKTLVSRNLYEPGSPLLKMEAFHEVYQTKLVQ